MARAEKRAGVPSRVLCTGQWQPCRFSPPPTHTQPHPFKFAFFNYFLEVSGHLFWGLSEALCAFTPFGEVVSTQGSNALDSCCPFLSWVLGGTSDLSPRCFNPQWFPTLLRAEASVTMSDLFCAGAAQVPSCLRSFAPATPFPWHIIYSDMPTPPFLYFLFSSWHSSLLQIIHIFIWLLVYCLSPRLQCKLHEGLIVFSLLLWSKCL